MDLFTPASLIPGKSLKRQATSHTKDLKPTHKAAHLLASEQRKVWLENLQNLFEKPLYQTFYLPAIHRFAEYVQDLPIVRLGPFSTPGGLLDQGLSRASHAMTLVAAHFFVKTKNFHHLNPSHPQAPWLYALFTSALFLDIDLLISDYQVMLYDESRQVTGLWQIFSGSMLDAAAYFYRIHTDTHQASPPSLRLSKGCLASYLLGRGTKTHRGFDWMAGQAEVLEAWLALLAGEEGRSPMHPMMELLPFAAKQAIDERLKKLAQKNKSTFYNAQLEETQLNAERNLGDRFLKWLQQRIQLGEIAVNTADESSVRRVENGVLISKKLIQQFQQLSALPLDVNVVERQLQATLALYPGSVNEQGRQALGGTAQALLGQWLLAHNPALVFGIGKVPPIYLLDSLGAPTKDANRPGLIIK